jgi:hypothetical protein
LLGGTLLGRPSQRKTKNDDSSQTLMYVLHCSNLQF